MTDTAELKPVLASEVLANQLDTAVTQAAATDVFLEQFFFADRSLKDWSADLSVYIPKDITVDKLKDCYTQLALKTQQAHALHAYASSVHNALSQGGNQRKASLMKAIVADFKTRNAKRPGVDVLKDIADSYLSDTRSHQLAAKIAKEYFREIRDGLIETRKCLEQYQFLLHMEQKLQEP